MFVFWKNVKYKEKEDFDLLMLLFVLQNRILIKQTKT